MFKVGDIVTGIPSSTYDITNEKSLCEVVQIRNNYIISVRVVDHETKKHYIGNEYIVDKSKFKFAFLGNYIE